MANNSNLRKPHGDLSRDFAAIETIVVQLGQAADMVMLHWANYLSDSDRNRLQEWSEALDQWRSYARDAVCDYAPLRPAPANDANASPAADKQGEA